MFNSVCVWGQKQAFLLGPGDLQDFAAEKTHSSHFLGVNMTVFIIFCRKTDKKRAKKDTDHLFHENS